ncbi:MAG: hypothetical protein Q4A28_06160 [Brachymonas sp.]|nr:hypothetical protein [Brachymonas sp.]
MPIKQGDVVLLKSQVMADVPEGGGGPSAQVIKDGSSNDIFIDVSDANRLLGNVSLRQVAVAVQTDDTDTLMGLHVTTTQPEDPGVSVMLFADGGHFTRRADAAGRVEAWLFASATWPGFLLENHIKGMRTIQIFVHPKNADARPPIGKTLMLVQDEGKVSERAQYIRITKVSSVRRTFVHGDIDYEAIVQTLELSDPLEMDFKGTPPNRQFVPATGAAILRDTTVADAARYYGTRKLATPAKVGDLHIKADGIYGQLVPSSQTETLMTDLSAAGQGIAVISAGQDAWCEYISNQPLNSANRLLLGSPCEPGTLSIVTGSGTLTDDGGRLVLAGQTIGTVDYGAGVVHCTQQSITSSLAVRFRAAVAPVVHYDSDSYAVTAANRSYNWSHTLPSPPAKATLHVGYMAGGNWYELWDDGSGTLRGADPAFGVGRLEAASLTATATLGALPDVGSEVIWWWAIAGDYDTSNPAAGKQVPLYVALPIGQDMPRPCTIVWQEGTDGSGAKRTAICDELGDVTGDATGYMDIEGGRMMLQMAALPPMGQLFTVHQGLPKPPDPPPPEPGAPEPPPPPPPEPKIGQKWSQPVTGFQADGATSLTILLGKEICKGCAIVYVPLVSAKGEEVQGGGSSSAGLGGTSSGSREMIWAPIAGFTVRLRDNGQGQMVLDTALVSGSPIGKVLGTVDYTRGEVFIQLGGLHVPFPCRVTQRNQRQSAGLTGIGGQSSYHAGTKTRTDPVRCDSPGSATIQYAEPYLIIEQDPNTSPSPGPGGSGQGTGDPKPPEEWKPELVKKVEAKELIGTIPAIAESLTLAHALLSFDGVLPGDGIRQTAVATMGALWGVRSDGHRVEMAPLDVNTGKLVLKKWVAGGAGSFGVQALLRHYGTTPLLYNLTWRVPQIPLKPQQFQLRARSTEQTYQNLRDNQDGDITAAGVTGHVNHTTGVVRVGFEKGVYPETLRYNATAYSYLPIGADVLGLNPVRLPQDGRVPMCRAGDIVIVSDARVSSPTTFSNGQTLSLGRERISRVRLVGDNGLGIHKGYTVDLDAGTVTATDVSDWSQPVRVHHYVEDAVQAIEVQIDGTIKIGAPLSHDYQAGATVHSALYLGDRFARVSRVFDQDAWDGKTWNDTLVGNPASASYDTRLAPVVVTNRGAVSERWALKFVNATEVDVIGEHVGNLGRFSINQDIAPTNPNAGGAPYFAVKAVGFGAGWSAGNTLFIHTVAAAAPFWIVRTVQKGQGAVLDDRFELACRYNVDRPGPDQQVVP